MSYQSLESLLKLNDTLKAENVSLQASLTDVEALLKDSRICVNGLLEAIYRVQNELGIEHASDCPNRVYEPCKCWVGELEWAVEVAKSEGKS